MSNEPTVEFFCGVCGLVLRFARRIVGSKAKIERYCPICQRPTEFLRGVFDV